MRERRHDTTPHGRCYVQQAEELVAGHDETLDVGHAITIDAERVPARSSVSPHHSPATMNSSGRPSRTTATDPETRTMNSSHREPSLLLGRLEQLDDVPGGILHEDLKATRSGHNVVAEGDAF